MNIKKDNLTKEFKSLKIKHDKALVKVAKKAVKEEDKYNQITKTNKR